MKSILLPCCLQCPDDFLADSLSDAEKEEDGLLIKGIFFWFQCSACSLSEIVCYFLPYKNLYQGIVGPGAFFPDVPDVREHGPEMGNKCFFVSDPFFFPDRT